MLSLALPLWCLARRCLLSVVGQEENDNHAAGFMLEGLQSEESGTRLPAQLRGVFYMRNNPLDDDLVCFERGVWDADNKSLLLPVYIPRAWTFKQNPMAFGLLVAVKLIRYRYRFDFKEDEAGKLTAADIYLQIFCITVPKSIVHFGMTDVSQNKDGSLWERWSLFLGFVGKSYWAERVLDAAGQETSYMEHVKSEVPAKCISSPAESWR